MIRSTNHSSYPRVADSPLDQQVRTAMRAHRRGKLAPEELLEVEDEVTTLVVADQARAFIDVMTDGMVRWDGPHSRLSRWFQGLEARGLVRWFETNFYDRQLAAVGEIRRNEASLVHDYEVAAGVALHRPVRPVLPGPVTIARRLVDEHYGELAACAGALADALAAEVSDLAVAGARWFQLDEPALCRHPEDLELVCHTASTIFAAAGEGASTILSTYYGDLVALGGEVEALPGTHLGLDMVGAGSNFEVLRRLPEGKGVVLGLFDASTTRQEDAADVAEVLAPHRDTLMTRDVFVGPNAGLELLPRDQAFDKLLHARYLVEKLTKEWEWPS